MFATSAVRTVPGTPAGRADRRIVRCAVLPPPGHRPARRGPDRQCAGLRRRDRGRRNPRRRTSFWRCSGTPRSASTIFGCSPRWWRPRPHRRDASRAGRSDRVTVNVDSDQPRDRRGAAHRRADRRGRGRRCGRPRQGGTTGLGRGWPPPSGPRRCAPSPQRSTRTSTSWRSLRCANSGHPIGNARVGGRPRPRRPAVLLRYAGAVVRQADSGGRRAGRHVQRAARRRRRHHSVELPDDDRVVGFRARAGRGKRGAGQTGGMDAADHHPARRARRRRRAAGRPVSGAARQGLGGGGAVRHPPRRAQDRVHRIHRGRHAGDGRRGRTGQAGHSGTGRQERQHRVRRLRPGEGGGDRAVRRVRQRRSGLLCAQPNPGAAQRLRPVHGAARTRRQGRRGRRPDVEGHRDGPAGVRSRTGDTVASYVPDDAPVAFRGDAPSGPGTGSRRPC